MSSTFPVVSEAERNVILKAALVRKFRSIEDLGTVRSEPDVTCLIGKNESGKTAFLEALHRPTRSAVPTAGSASSATPRAGFAAGTGRASPTPFPSRPPSS
jgi:ABC-type cobalamin/Fe3+-siderophores transport system ATPase subunit